MSNILKFLPLFVVFMAVLEVGQAQQVLNNPSFEDEPADATMPMGWFSTERGTTPDILPGPWGVTTEPFEGETYVGLITRIDHSFESIGQRLAEPFEKGACYSFSFAMHHSNTYNGYNEIIYLRIWGGTRKGKSSQLLYQSTLKELDDWEEIKVKFTAEKKLKYIKFEAYWPEDKEPRNGHILIDNISPIKKCTKV